MYKNQFVILTFRHMCIIIFLIIQHTMLKLSGHYLFGPVETHEKIYTVELVSLRRHALRDRHNFT
jgi:hypothetical protein